MVNDSATLNMNEDMERNAYNAAFHELGFRWHWDRDTYHELFSIGSNPVQTIRHYLETRQAHLLTAYDAPFLVRVIQEKKAQHLKRRATASTTCRHFDWAQVHGFEIGA